MTDPKPLKLLAQDAEDIQIIAAVLQDAIAPVEDMAYRAGEKSFVMVVQRFCWDCLQGEASKPPEGESPFARINCALDITGVEQVQYLGLEPKAVGGLLELLTLKLEEDGLYLIFAGGGKVRLKLENWQVRLRDFGESWPVCCCPRHAT